MIPGVGLCSITSVNLDMPRLTVFIGNGAHRVGQSTPAIIYLTKHSPYFRRLATDLLDHILVSLDEAIRQGYLNLEWISPERFFKARELRFRFIDKLMISFTDLTSMVVMKELGIKSILTDDDHFVQVGMGFQKVP